MSRRETRTEDLYTVRIPADVDRPDEILFGLSARQVAVLVAVAAGVLLAWRATRTLVPAAVFGLFAVVIAAAAVGLVLCRRDGVGLDRLVVAAVRQRLAPRRLVPAPGQVEPAPDWVSADSGPLPAPLRLPADAIGSDGVVDLGRDGVAVLCATSTVNFALRTPAEQVGLVAGMASWLNSLTGPVQILIRADRIELAGLIRQLEDEAPGLPDPALEAAATEHACWLTELAGTRDLLRRQVLLVLREPAAPGRRQAAAARVARRADEAARALAGCQVTVQVLDGAAASAVLACAAAPYDPPPPAGPYAAPPGGIITARHPASPLDNSPLSSTEEW